MYAIFLALGIDWGQIFIASVFGALGGALGFWVAYRLLADKISSRFKIFLQPAIAVLIFSIFTQIPNIFDISFPGQMAGSKLESEISSLLEKDEFLGVILKDFPEIKPGFIDRLTAAYQKEGKTAFNNEIAIIGQEIGSKYIKFYIKTAPKEAILELIEVTIKTLDVLAKTNTNFCFHWLFGGDPNLGEKISEFIPQEFHAAMKSAIEGIILSGSSDVDYEILSDARMNELRVTVVFGVESNIDPADLNWEALAQPNLNATDFEKRQVCVTILEFYKEMGNLPEEDKVKFFRALNAVI